MQNFWPCKSLSKRNGHLDTSGISSGGHSVTYEDPDAQIHHRPLVMRHQNVEVSENIRIKLSTLLNSILTFSLSLFFRFT